MAQITQEKAAYPNIDASPAKSVMQAAAQSENDENSVTTKLVRFLHPVPKFVGRELEVYGPFEREDIANLPKEIAEVLIIKGRAEEMTQS